MLIELKVYEVQKHVYSTRIWSENSVLITY